MEVIEVLKNFHEKFWLFFFTFEILAIPHILVWYSKMIQRKLVIPSNKWLPAILLFLLSSALGYGFISIIVFAIEGKLQPISFPWYIVAGLTIFTVLKWEKDLKKIKLIKGQLESLKNNIQNKISAINDETNRFKTGSVYDDIPTDEADRTNRKVSLEVVNILKSIIKH